MANVTYSASERKRYHNMLARKGATVTRPDGSTKKVSDFERGVHKAKADFIHKAQVKTFKKYNK